MNENKMNSICYRYYLTKNIQRFVIKSYRQRKNKTIRSINLDENLCNHILSFYLQ